MALQILPPPPAPAGASPPPAADERPKLVGLLERLRDLTHQRFAADSTRFARLKLLTGGDEEYARLETSHNDLFVAEQDLAKQVDAEARRVGEGAKIDGAEVTYSNPMSKKYLPSRILGVPGLVTREGLVTEIKIDERLLQAMVMSGELDDQTAASLSVSVPATANGRLQIKIPNPKGAS